MQDNIYTNKNKSNQYELLEQFRDKEGYTTILVRWLNKDCEPYTVGVNASIDDKQKTLDWGYGLYFNSEKEARKKYNEKIDNKKETKNYER